MRDDGLVAASDRRCSVCLRELDAGEVATCWLCIGTARSNLITIVDLVALLPEHATSAATHGHLAASEPIPGGDALVMLERGSEGLSDDAGTNPGDPEPPAWVLGWWEEVWRESLALGSRRPVWQRRASRTIADASRFLGDHLDWAAHYHSGFETFASDLAKTRRHLEALLQAGDAPLEGVACFECGATLQREYRAPRACSCPPRPIRGPDAAIWEQIHAGHDQGGLRNPDLDHGWHCPRCRRDYSAGEYRLAVQAAYDAAADFRTVTDVTRLTGCPRGTVQGWSSRGQVRRRKDSSGRVTYSISDVRARLTGDSRTLDHTTSDDAPQQTDVEN
jgi:hypothetical protein